MNYVMILDLFSVFRSVYINPILVQMVFEYQYVCFSVCVCQGFYNEVASPLLSAVDMRYPDNIVNSLTTNHFPQLFNGSEIVVAGRLNDNDIDNFLVEVFAQGVSKNLDFGINLPIIPVGRLPTICMQFH